MQSFPNNPTGVLAFPWLVWKVARPDIEVANAPVGCLVAALQSGLRDVAALEVSTVMTL